MKITTAPPSPRLFHWLSAFLVVLGISSQMASGATREWVSNSGSSLPTAARWSGNAVPTTSDEALFATLVPPSVLTTGNTLTWGNLIWNTAGSSTIQLADSNMANRTFTLTGGGGYTAAIAAGGATGDLILLGTNAGGQTLTISGQPNPNNYAIILQLGTSGNFNVVNESSHLLISSAIWGTDYSLTKTGAGTLTLSGGNTFAGAGQTFTLEAGRLNINATNALGSGSGTFILNGGSIDNTSGATVVTNAKAHVWNADVDFIGTNSLTLASTANITLGTTPGSSRTVTVQNNTLRINGVIANGITANSLVKDGAGTLLLIGNNTFTGATNVEEGVLGGTGSLTGALVVKNGGALAPGFNTTGTFASGHFTLESGGTFSLEINTTSLASDLLSITGDLSLTSGGLLTLTDLGANVPLVEGTTFTFMEYSGTWNGGLFTYNSVELADDSIFTFGANQYRISYNGLDDLTSAVILTVVPEPSASLLLLGAGISAWVVSRSRLRRK